MNAAVMTDKQIQQLDENTKLTKDIHQAVIGNPGMGHTGLVERQRRTDESIREQGARFDAKLALHSERIDRLDKLFIKYGGVAFGILVAWEVYKAFVVGIR